MSKITPTFNNVVRDFSLSTYDIKGGDLADAERSLIVHLTNSKVEVQTQPTADGTGTYTVTLPRVDFRVNIAVRTSLSTNNGQGVSLDGENFFAIGGTTLTMLSDGQKIVVTLCSASGTTLQTIEIVDTDIIYGYKGIVFYVKGIRYTSVYLSSMVGMDYYNYMMPFDTLSAMQQNVQLAKSVGDELLFYQLQTYNASTVGSDWQRLKLYVSSKLAKDVNADVDSLIDAFCDAYFGTAASEMKQLLATERTDLYNNRNASGKEDWYGLTNGSALLLNKKCFTLSALKGYMATIDSAKAKVQTAYENGNLTALERDKLIANIDIESLTFRYMLISLHGDTTYDESLDAFKTFAHSLGVVALGENVAN